MNFWSSRQSVLLDMGTLCSGKNDSPLGAQPTLMLPTDTGSETFTVQLWSLYIICQED